MIAHSTRNFRKLIKQPYPIRTDKASKILLASCCGFFVFLFLAIFQPFGINDLNIGKILISSFLFGLTTMLCMLFNDIFVSNSLPAAIKEETWTVKKQIVWLIYNTAFISFFNFLIASAINITHLSTDSFLLYFFFTVSTSIFPISIITIFDYLRLVSKNSQIASQITPNLNGNIPKNLDDTIQIIAENGKDKLICNPRELLFIDTTNNYSTVYLAGQESIKEVIIRGSLGHLEHQIKYDFIRRCHRSYIVNLQRVKKVTGNAQGYKLHFEESTIIIPVSRKYAPEILGILRGK